MRLTVTRSPYERQGFLRARLNVNTSDRNDLLNRTEEAYELNYEVAGMYVRRDMYDSGRSDARAETIKTGETNSERNSA